MNKTEFSSSEKSDSKICCDEKTNINSMVESLKRVLLGEPPEGYVAYAGSEIEYKLKKYFSMREKVKYIGSCRTIKIWEIKNLSKCEREILEKDLNFEGTVWVYLDKSCLGSKEKTLAVTCVRNYE